MTMNYSIDFLQPGQEKGCVDFQMRTKSYVNHFWYIDKTAHSLNEFMVYAYFWITACKNEDNLDTLTILRPTFLYTGDMGRCATSCSRLIVIKKLMFESLIFGQERL